MSKELGLKIWWLLVLLEVGDWVLFLIFWSLEKEFEWFGVLYRRENRKYSMESGYFAGIVYADWLVERRFSDYLVIPANFVFFQR